MFRPNHLSCFTDPRIWFNLTSREHHHHHHKLYYDNGKYDDSVD